MYTYTTTIHLLKESIDCMTPSNQSHENVSSFFTSFTNIFDLYPSEYTQMKFMREEGHFTEPESYTIGERNDYKEENGVQVSVAVPMTAQFIPLRQTLESFFNLKNVLPETLFYMNELFEAGNNSDIVSNFIQGSYWRDLVQTYYQNEVVVPLILYFDEFEVNNALGSHAGVNKLGAFYCTIPCLPIQFQSKLENIFLAIFFNVKDQKYTDDKFIFMKLIKELNFLADTGITFNNLEHGSQKVYFQLALIIGDNLGIHSIWGFVESFSAHYPYRFCSINK